MVQAISEEDQTKCDHLVSVAVREAILRCASIAGQRRDAAAKRYRFDDASLYRAEGAEEEADEIEGEILALLPVLAPEDTA